MGYEIYTATTILLLHLVFVSLTWFFFLQVKLGLLRANLWICVSLFSFCLFFVKDAVGLF